MNEVVAVIVTYNRKELLRECLEKVRQQQNAGADILVFDNASTDGTREMMGGLEDGNTVRYHREEKNLGGAGGFCRGMEIAVLLGYKYLWLMDDDTQPRPDALEKLLSADRRLGGRYGFLASRVLWTDGSVCAMNRQRVSLFRDVKDDANRPEKVIMSSFVSLFIRSSVVCQAGLPIREFYIWSDDWEYTRRISRRMDCFLIPESVVVHAMKSNKPVNIATDLPERIPRYKYFYRNDVVLFRREGPKGWLYLLAKDLWHTIQVLKTGEDVPRRIKTIWGGFWAGTRFFPSTPMIENTQRSRDKWAL